MPNTGYKLPETAQDVVDQEVFDPAAWTNVNRIKLADSSFASIITTNYAATDNHWLFASNFNFAIPSGATIDGIEVETRAYDDYGITDLAFSMAYQLYYDVSSGSGIYDSTTRAGRQKTISTTYDFKNTSDPAHDGYAYAYDIDDYLYFRSPTAGSGGNNTHIIITYSGANANASATIDVDEFQITIDMGAFDDGIDFYYTTTSDDVKTLIDGNVQAASLVVVEVLTSAQLNGFTDQFLQHGFLIPGDVPALTMGSPTDTWYAGLACTRVYGTLYGIEAFATGGGGDSTALEFRTSGVENLTETVSIENTYTVVVNLAETGAQTSHGSWTVVDYTEIGPLDDFQVAGIDFKAQAGAVTPGDAKYQAATSNAATAASLAAQINAHPVASTYVVASSDGDYINAEALTPGSAGDSIIFAYYNNEGDDPGIDFSLTASEYLGGGGDSEVTSSSTSVVATIASTPAAAAIMTCFAESYDTPAASGPYFFEATSNEGLGNINNSNFGILIRPDFGVDWQDITEYVDYVKIKVYYTGGVATRLLSLLGVG